jgi:hypothetical protein
MNNETNTHIREEFFKWAKEYGVDHTSHEEWNKFLSVWNACLDYLEVK